MGEQLPLPTASHAPSYWIDERLASAEAFYAQACDPRNSVVVEACAGAGKTWMLVSRILRALLDGVPAHEILAITFTRKAAAEMRERLMDWLREFAAAEPAARIEALRQRGMDAELAVQQQAALGGLYRQVLEQGRTVEIHTFHGWFSRLLRAAPLDLLAEIGLPPEPALIEETAELRPQLWRRFLGRIDGDPALRGDYAELVRELGRRSTDDWLLAALSRRTEIEAAQLGGSLDASVAPPDACKAAWDGVDAEAALGTADWTGRLLALARAWGAHSGVTAQKHAALLEQAVSLPDPAARFEAVRKALFTDKGEPRKKLPELAGWPALADELQELAELREQQRACRLHGCMVRLSAVLLEAYAELKRERGLADMADLEAGAVRLLRDATLSGWVQERLDARVRQVLIDEFQDTSPLQWQALQAWLAGYAGAGGGTSGREPPGVFIVGDPKQSIYRFRGAEPRVFAAASDFVVHGLGGRRLGCDHTRRNAPAVLAALNAVFTAAGEEGAFSGFRPHTTASTAPGRVRALPVIARADRAGRKARAAEGNAPARAEGAAPARIEGAGDGPAGGLAGGLAFEPTVGGPDPTAAPPGIDAWRDTLTTPRLLPEEALRLQEGRQIAAAIAELVAGGVPAGEVFVLSRKREALRWVAQALRERGIDHVAPEDRALLDAPEARDVIAVLDALVSPGHDLSLAHALRCPLFGATDEELIALSRPARPGGWWAALMAGSWDEASQPALHRAQAWMPRWQALAAHLPPHDWLDRIVAQGRWRERLAAAVAEAHRASALAHLDAVLNQALALDGGRYATPYGFVRALKRQPLAMPPQPQPDAVQLLTVHGAKGLEARVVFIADADGAPPKPDTCTLLIDWPVEAAHPLRCAFVRSESRPPPSLRQVMADEMAARRREELNGLYVAMTRARELLVFSRIEPHQKTDVPSWWQRVAAAGAVEAEPWLPPAGEPPAVTAGLPQAPEAPQAPRAIELPVLPAWVPPAAEPASPATLAEPDGASTLQAEGAAVSAADLGRAVHRALERLTALPAAWAGGVVRADWLARAAEQAVRELHLPVSATARVQALARPLISRPELTRWLDPTQVAWAANEVELVHEGELLRLDRLVAVDTPQGREWWVLDYKLAHRPQDEPELQAQMARYRRAVQALKPGEVIRTALIGGAGELVQLD
jgi:ATP-dependent helicase/nuclease subunit A